MIVNRPGSHFIFVFHSDCVYKEYNYINYQGKPLKNKEYLEHWGKYVFLGPGEEMDELAKKLGISPVEIRRLNAYHQGSVTATGQVLTDGVGMLETLERAVENSGYEEKGVDDR